MATGQNPLVPPPGAVPVPQAGDDSGAPGLDAVGKLAEGPSQRTREEHPVFSKLADAVSQAVRYYVHSPVGKAVTLGPDLDKDPNFAQHLKAVAEKGPERAAIEDPYVPSPDPEQPWNRPFARFRQGLTNMSSDLRRYADRNQHVLTPGAYALLHGVAGALDFTPVGGSAVETAAMLPVGGIEGKELRAALKEGKSLTDIIPELKAHPEIEQRIKDLGLEDILRKAEHQQNVTRIVTKPHLDFTEVGGKEVKPTEPNRDVVGMTPREPEEVGRVTGVRPSKREGFSIYEHTTPEGYKGTFQFRTGAFKVGDTIRGERISLADAAAQGAFDVEPKPTGPQLVKPQQPRQETKHVPTEEFQNKNSQWAVVGPDGHMYSEHRERTAAERTARGIPGNTLVVSRAEWEAGPKEYSRNKGKLLEMKPATPDMPSEDRVSPRVGPSGFYSGLEHTIENKLPDKMTGEQLISTLRNTGVPQRELEAAGIEDLAREPKHVNKLRESLTKDEVLQHVRENTPQVETVEKSAKTFDPYFSKLNEKYVTAKERIKASLRNELGFTDQQANSLLDEHIETDEDDFDPTTLAHRIQNRDTDWAKALPWAQKHADKFQELNDLQLELRSQEEPGFVEGSGPKYESYTLPGGKNYREVLITLPEREIPWSREKGARLRELDDIQTYGRFVNGETQYLTPAEEDEHLKLRKDALERDNRSEPYSGPHFDEPNVVAHLRLKDRTDVNGKKTLFIEELQSDWARELRESREPVEGNTPADEGMRAARSESRVPPMPFDKSWHELALKQALKIAVDEGYDQVAWTTGAQQADRYNLRNYFDDITYQKDGTLSATPKDQNLRPGDQRTVHQKVSPEDLYKYVGKENAAKLLEQLENKPGQSRPTDPKTGKPLRNQMARLQLDEPIGMGGEHHLRLYDEMVPQYLNKYTRKWGGKVGETEIKIPQSKAKAGQTIYPTESMKVQTLPITPQLRDAVKQGQPLFGGGTLDFTDLGGKKVKDAPGIVSPEGRKVQDAPRAATPDEPNLDKSTSEFLFNESGDYIGKKHAVDELIDHGGKPITLQVGKRELRGVIAPHDVTFYHGTDANSAYDIMNNGLKPMSKDFRAAKSSNLGSLDTAYNFVGNSIGYPDAEPGEPVSVVLKVTVPKGTKLYNPNMGGFVKQSEIESHVKGQRWKTFRKIPDFVKVFDTIPAKNIEVFQALDSEADEVSFNFDKAPQSSKEIHDLGSTGTRLKGEPPESILPRNVEEVGKSLGISQYYRAQLRGATGLSTTKNWYDLVKEYVESQAKKNPYTRSIDPALVESKADDALLHALDSVKMNEAQRDYLFNKIKKGESIAFISPDVKGRGTAVHETMHSLTEQELGPDFLAEFQGKATGRPGAPQGRMNTEDIMQLAKDTTKGGKFSDKGPAYRDPATMDQEWLSRRQEYFTELMTQYFIGNLNKGSKSERLAEAILRTSKNPKVQALLGTSLGAAIYYNIQLQQQNPKEER